MLRALLEVKKATLKQSFYVSLSHIKFKKNVPRIKSFELYLLDALDSAAVPSKVLEVIRVSLLDKSIKMENFEQLGYRDLDYAGLHENVELRQSLQQKLDKYKMDLQFQSLYNFADRKKCFFYFTR